MQRQDVVDAIIGEVRTILRRPNLAMDASTRLSRLDLDSLECVYLIADVEDMFEIDISCAERVDTDTVGTLADLVMRKTADRASQTTHRMRIAA